MDIKAYIGSGILEAYVLDALSPEERADVQRHMATYAEIAAEVAAIESAMQSYAEAHAETPPAYMQERIWNAVSAIPGESQAANTSRTMPFAPAERRRQYSWANAAMLIALIGSLAVNIMFWSQKNNMNSELATTKQHLETTQQMQAELMAQVSMAKQEKDMLADTSMRQVLMKSMVPGHPMAATVHWNKEKGEAYLHMQKLPVPEKGKQYQMWVIQNGVPVSMGILPNEVAEGKLIAKLPMEVKDGEAFAISLEKIGGNATPTEVMVLGKV